MNLLGGIALVPGWLDDPEILDWALDRVMDERELELPADQCHAGALFDSERIAHLLTTHDARGRARLYTCLPWDRFRPLLERLAQAWPGAEAEEVCELTGVLVQIAPERALALFADALGGAERPRDLERLYGMGAGLCQLAPAGAALVGSFIDAAERARVDSILDSTAALSVLHGRPDARHRLTRRTAEEEELPLDTLYEELSKDGMFDLVLNSYEDDVAPFAEARGAFLPDAPIELLARALEGDEDVELPVGQPRGAARALPFFTREEIPDLYLAAVLDSWIAPAPDASAFSAADVLARLAADLPRHPHRAALIQRLRALPQPAVRAAFEIHRNKRHGNFAGQHLAYAAGQLADPALVGFLMQLWDDRALAAVGEEVMDSLARIGDAAVPALIARLDQGTEGSGGEAACGGAAGALAMIGGPAAEEALLRACARHGVETPGWNSWLPRRPLLPLIMELGKDRNALDDESMEILVQLMMLHEGPQAAEPAVDETPQRPVRVEQVGRNDPCPCGSGKKYKKCCGK